MRPSRSNRIIRVLVLPWSIAATYRVTSAPYARGRRSGREACRGADSADGGGAVGDRDWSACGARGHGLLELGFRGEGPRPAWGGAGLDGGRAVESDAFRRGDGAAAGRLEGLDREGDGVLGLAGGGAVSGCDRDLAGSRIAGQRHF